MVTEAQKSGIIFAGLIMMVLGIIILLAALYANGSNYILGIALLFVSMIIFMSVKHKPKPSVTTN